MERGLLLELIARLRSEWTGGSGLKSKRQSLDTKGRASTVNGRKHNWSMLTCLQIKTVELSARTQKKPTLEEIQSWGQSFERLMRSAESSLTQSKRSVFCFTVWVCEPSFLPRMKTAVDKNCLEWLWRDTDFRDRGTKLFNYFSAAGRKVFRDFLRGEYSEENIMFWLACEELKRETDPDAVEEKARFIYEDYISILSPKEIVCGRRLSSTRTHRAERWSGKEIARSALSLARSAQVELTTSHAFSTEAKVEPQSRSGAKVESGLNRDDPLYLSVYLSGVSSEWLNRSRCDFHWEIEELTGLRLVTPGFVEIVTVIESGTKSRFGNGVEIRIESETGTKIENGTRIENDCGDGIRIKCNWDRSRKRDRN
ncbi:Regulator of G-protein signaling 17 [Eumeta japonica]|uniref:Regulator of G-protein signaling 17 n=1 Tax=Eumeta variegata TaxID=151549 RepID=A0A4C1T8F8_EUMVA|nr:Regulator of G-protein signaling 17 [Eumeta japonica]